MAILKVNPTRVNLLSLKSKLKTAQKGHKLLKDKRDGLIQRFMAIIKETEQLRARVDEKLGNAFHSYVRSSSMVNKKMLDTAFLVPGSVVSLNVSTDKIMAVSVPQFEINKSGSGFSYGFLETQGDLDNAVRAMDDVFTDLVKLAEQEKTIERLADEIEKTRRRTNALEHVMIPNLQETIGYINLRLEEQQRDATVSSMRVKEMITEEEA